MSFELLFHVLVLTYFGILITALLVNGIWVAPFIERHGRKTAGFFSYWMMGTGLISDYLIARRLCKFLGVWPPWMKWFGVLFWIWIIYVAAAFTIIPIAYVASELD